MHRDGSTHSIHDSQVKRSVLLTKAAAGCKVVSRVLLNMCKAEKSEVQAVMRPNIGDQGAVIDLVHPLGTVLG